MPSRGRLKALIVAASRVARSTVESGHALRTVHPQGWRLDLAGIPTDKHWQVMRDLADHADAGPWDSLWVYDHFHTVPIPTDEATHEAWT